jgi:hypothetical protein
MLFGRLKLYAAAVGAFIVALVLAFFGGRRSGIIEGKVKSTQDTLDKMRTAKGIENEIELLDDAGLADRASKWVREPDQ